MNSYNLEQDRLLKVGITGHQDLIDKDTAVWVSDQIKNIISSIKVNSAFSCLAVGADQIFAQTIIDQNLQLVAVIPCKKIIETFKNEEEKQKFNYLLSHAKEEVYLPFNDPSEEAFFAGGKEIVDRSDIILAVWNGRPAQGLGGTGDVIKYALNKGVHTIHIDLINKRVISLESD